MATPAPKLEAPKQLEAWVNAVTNVRGRLATPEEWSGINALYLELTHLVDMKPDFRRMRAWHDAGRPRLPDLDDAVLFRCLYDFSELRDARRGGIERHQPRP
jgi:hypothetical protein